VIIDRLEVSYWEGWDPQARAAVGPLSAPLAAERDRAGAQYCVLLSAPGPVAVRPLAVIEVAWRELYCAVRFFDGEGRRALELDFRRLEQDRVALIGGHQWQYRDATVPEYAHFDDQSLQYVFRSVPGGQLNGYNVGGRLDRQMAPAAFWLDAPRFGEWGRFIADGLGFALAAMGHEMAPGVPVADVSDPSGAGLPGAGELPWHPPRPLVPSHLDELFTPGMRFALHPANSSSGTTWSVTVEVWPAGTLRMPTGRLIACDPTWRDWGDPFAVTAPPGDYPVSLSVVRFSDDPEHIRVAAAKLAIRDMPAATWEMALLAGEDPRILGDGGFFGFGVDRATGCFVDVSAAGSLDRFKEGFVLEGEHTELADPESGANLIAYHSGWGDGSYPTWIGRDGTGEVVCFVSDMLVLGPGATTFSQRDSEVTGG
jgi:hypothetical protein